MSMAKIDGDTSQRSGNIPNWKILFQFLRAAHENEKAYEAVCIYRF